MTTKYHYNVKINTNNLGKENVTKIIISNLFEGEIDENQKDKIEVLHSGHNVWKNFLRNIPQNIKNGDLEPKNTSIILHQMKKKITHSCSDKPQIQRKCWMYYQKRCSIKPV